MVRLESPGMRLGVGAGWRVAGATHQEVRVVVVVAPVRPDFPLASNVPHVELEALGGHGFDVEALVGGGGGRRRRKKGPDALNGWMMIIIRKRKAQSLGKIKVGRGEAPL